MPYSVTKQYGHERGLSCCFRQWRANSSHCHWLHGYALAFEFKFNCSELDERNWVVDFGALKPLLAALQDTFDHKLVVAADDPHKDTLCALAGVDCADVLVLPQVSMERFAEHAFRIAEKLIRQLHPPQPFKRRVWVEYCRAWEHGSNSAIYTDEANR